MDEEKVVQRDDDDPQREGREVVEEEPVAQRKKEPKKTGKAKRKSSAKKSGEQGIDTDAGLRNKHLDRGSVIELLEKNALKAAFGPGNKDEMEDCYPILISFMRNLTDEQWQVIYKGFKKPMTKEQLAKLCKTIVDFIAQTTLQILLPALARILGVTGFYYNTDSLKRGGSARSFTAFEQKRLDLIQEVKYLAKEMCNCGSRALRPRSSTPSSKSSQTSVKFHLGMPEDSIISSVQEQLSDHEILASCPPELTVGLIKEVLEQLNLALSLTISRTISGRSSPIASGTQAAEQMINMVQKFFYDHTAPEDQLDVDSYIPSATEEVITVIADMVDELEGEDADSVKLLQEVAVKVKMLASGSDLAVEQLDDEDFSFPKELNLCISCKALVKNLDILSSDKFKTKASKSVSEILVRWFPRGTSGLVQHSHSFTATPSLMNVSDPDTIHHSVATGLIQTNMDFEAPNIIDSFVEDVKGIVTQAELDKPPSTQRDPQVGHCMSKRKPFHMSRRLCDRLQAKIKELFQRTGGAAFQREELLEKADSRAVLLEHTDSSVLPGSILNSSSASRSESLIAECSSSAVPGSVEEKPFETRADCTHGQNSLLLSKSEAILQEVNSTGRGALHKCQSANSQPLLVLCDPNLEPCTKEILSQIVTVYRSEMADLESTSSVVESSSYNSFEVCDFLDGIMSYLEDMPVSSSSSLEGVSVTPASVIEQLSSEVFQKKATNKVRKILNKSVNLFPSEVGSSQTDSQMSPALSTISSKHTDSVAFEIVGSIANDMKSIFLLTESPTNLWQADSMLQLSDEKTSEATKAAAVSSQTGVEVSEKKIWITAKTIYHNVKAKMRNYFSLQRQAKATKAQAKKTLSHILLSIQKELSKSDQMVAAGQLSQIDKVVGTMLENIEKISSECGEELVDQESLRSSSSLSFSTAKSQKTEWEFALPGTPIPSELPESTAQPIVRCSVIDMSESTKPKTLVCDARTSMFAIADSIMKKVYPEAEGQVTSHPDLTDAIARLEELISQGRIGALSRDLSHQVNHIISDSNLTPLVLTVAAGKSASDTVLSKLKRNDKVGKPTTYELVQLFVEESVKCLLLPSFVPYLTSMSLAQGAKVLARVSEDRISCSSSSSVFSDTVSLFTKVMVSQVMDSVVSDAQSRGSSPTESLRTSETTISDVGNLLSGKSSPRLSLSGVIMATSETSNAAQIFKANIDGEEVDTTSHSGVAQNIVRDDMSTSPDMVKDVPLRTPSSDNLGSDDDFTGLISMLVVRILTKIQTPTEDYPVDITRKSQDLIPKVMDVFCAWSGCSETQAYPENLRIHKVYRAIYKNLLEEFGSEKILQQAVSTQDSSFDRILVKSLSEELLHRCNEALRAASRTSVKTTGPKALPLDEDVRASSGKLSFLQRLVRLTSNLKLFKKGKKKDSHRSESEQVQTTAEDGMLPSIVPHAAMSALPKDLPASSQQETPHKRPLLVRMFSAISKGLFKPFKQSLKTK
ncbi:uncharacterized protein isoform X2 [Salmo salar]|uniref:Uncharacterized protein isoform X2 n=1 Tax=Salmo salar TaxID=8030 RepID=A0A1S3PI06_SALSA|nr:uncharacterized protein LOC106585521 isoform X2 [Salmo salar]|eukprot:XP_014027295.1 PREDICTED: uncharacterized protein LOC106585521 isoform X2 [Salmo salar]